MGGLLNDHYRKNRPAEISCRSDLFLFFTAILACRNLLFFSQHKKTHRQKMGFASYRTTCHFVTVTRSLRT